VIHASRKRPIHAGGVIAQVIRKRPPLLIRIAADIVQPPQTTIRRYGVQSIVIGRIDNDLAHCAADVVWPDTLPFRLRTRRCVNFAAETRDKFNFQYKFVDDCAAYELIYANARDARRILRMILTVVIVPVIGPSFLEHGSDRFPIRTKR
jgi:hypothetical protein